MRAKYHLQNVVNCGSQVFKSRPGLSSPAVDEVGTICGGCGGHNLLIDARRDKDRQDLNASFICTIYVTL